MGEGGRRREGKERGHWSRAGAGSKLKVKDPVIQAATTTDRETRLGCGVARARRLGRGGWGTLAARRLYIAAGAGRWASGLGSWAPRLPVPPVPAVHLARACAVPWARPAAQTRHWASCRAGTGTGACVPCRPMGRAKSPCCGPCRRPMCWMEIYSYTTCTRNVRKLS
jgi:hypothetical protein